MATGHLKLLWPRGTNLKLNLKIIVHTHGALRSTRAPSCHSPRTSQSSTPGPGTPSPHTSSCRTLGARPPQTDTHCGRRQSGSDPACHPSGGGWFEMLDILSKRIYIDMSDTLFDRYIHCLEEMLRRVFCGWIWNVGEHPRTDTPTPINHGGYMV